jgi:transaldolase/glucose-6-phosphate isomerase
LVESPKLSKQVYNSLVGRAAIANARLAYAAYEHVFNGERYKKLAKNGAQLQRPLWASTSTKNPDYRDVMYVEQLIGPDTVNTVPPNTLSAFLDHGIAEMTIRRDLDQARVLFSQLSSHGIEIGTVAEELEIEGVKAFADAFTELIHSIEVRKESAKTEVGKFLPNVADQVSHLKSEKFIERFFNKDATLWTSDQNAYDEIHNRMNWVNAPVENQKMIPELENFRKECLESGITKAVVLGMGGSSLAPEVFSLMHSSTTRDLQGLEISILDSTDPEQVALTREKSPVATTLFIVASKSGTTGEINAFSEYFWKMAQNDLGKDAGQHFVAITDPGSPLEKLAKERGYRTVFAGDPKVGGRYSALTAFGLVPASLIGMDLRQLLDRAAWMAELSGMQQMQEANPGLVLGAYIGNGAIQGRNKLTILTDQEWGPFANWLEQLIAESSGKIGKGITPVVNEPEMDAYDYGNDRLFVYLRSAGQKDEFTKNLREVGQPVLTLQVGNEYDLGSQFYLWEVATPVACSIIGVNVFNQPDVQDAKTRTLNSIAAYKKDGRLTEPEPNRIIENTRIYSNRHFNHMENDTVLDVIGAFCRENVRTGDYIGINAFLPMTKYVVVELEKLRERLLQQEKVATMLGYGPRFLHSTGQLHKGGPDEGIFIIITARRSKDLDIPGEGISFGVMQRAQAMGDMDALEARGRRMIWIDLPDIQESLSNLN